MRDISPEEIEKFIIEHCPYEGWKDSKKIRPWINMMMGKGFIDAFTDDGTKLSVVLCSRMREENCLVIDLLLSTRDNILESIATHLIQKHGTPQNVHWKRGERQTTVRLERVAKHLLHN